LESSACPCCTKHQKQCNFGFIQMQAFQEIGACEKLTLKLKELVLLMLNA